MSAFPSGTITFLFADIEGSTQLWELHPEAMRRALAVHDEILREEITRHGGQVFKTVGDAVYAVFAAARDAIAAARSAQQRLTGAAWEVPGGLRVRMAIHTGAVEQTNGDYLGPPLNRVARLLSAGHGGQILVSESTRALVEHELPPDAGLRDHGLHRLKDLAQPEHIYQLIAPELSDAFPPLRSLDVFPNNLPRQLTSFVGREREMKEVKDLLSRTVLLTLTGPGGSGKTRLVLQVGADLIESFPDGVWLVELEALSDPARVPQAVAFALSVREEMSQRSLTDTLVDFLRPKSLLLILDNCEHVLSACASLAETLLRSCPHLRILATSQEGLRVSGELIYQVPSLSTPDPRRLPPLEQLTQYEAVRLFVERAAFSQPRFSLTPANASSVVQVVHRLDGIPLAIELAAARTKVLSVDQIAARLDDRFRLLTAGTRTAMPRHQTLQGVLDWSYELLSENERALLRRLSVFAGGFSLEAAEAICAGAGTARHPDVLDLLTRLVEKSLVIFDEQGGQPRYRLLETVRLFSRDLLQAAGEAQDVRSRHRDWYLLLAEQAEPLLVGPKQGQWLDRLELEHDNLRAALQWSKAEQNGAEAGLRLAGALWRFWEVRGYWTEGREWLEAMLAKSAGLEVPARVKALSGSAYLAFFQGDYNRARTLGEESLDLARKLGDKRGAASCLTTLGFEACRVENWPKAQELAEEGLRLSREVGDTFGNAGALAILGLVARAQGERRKAVDLLTESLNQLRETGDQLAMSLVLMDLGLVVRELGDQERAREIFEETLAVFRALGDRWGEAFSLSNLGIVAWAQHDYERSAGLFMESLLLRRGLGDKRGISTSLTGLATIAAAVGELEHSATLFGAAEALRESIGVPPPPFIRHEYEKRVEDLRNQLGEPAFGASWAKGRAMSLEQAIEYALA